MLIPFSELLLAELESVDVYAAIFGGAQRVAFNAVGQGQLAADTDSAIKEIMKRIEGLKKELSPLTDKFGTAALEITDKLSYPSAMKAMLDGAKIYVDEAIYGGTELGEVILNSQTAKTTIESLNAEFNYVSSSLDTSQRGAAITALVSKAGEVSLTLQQFSDHMDKLIV